jgi:hypothetical protein
VECNASSSTEWAPVASWLAGWLQQKPRRRHASVGGWRHCSTCVPACLAVPLPLSDVLPAAPPPYPHPPYCLTTEPMYFLTRSGYSFTASLMLLKITPACAPPEERQEGDAGVE